MAAVRVSPLRDGRTIVVIWFRGAGMNRLVEMLDADRPVVCIAGPTASGKSGFALDVAKRVGGEVVNADALQVYADLIVLSARPTEEEMDGVTHHLFGHIPGDRLYSTGDWVREVIPVLKDIIERGKVPVLCGGTGLYFHALLVGLADIPEVPQSLSEAVDRIEIGALREEALKVDPIATDRVLGDDPQRLARIVGVYRATGRALSDWQAQTNPLLTPDRTQRFVLMPARDELYAGINARFDSMVEQGGLAEARRVADRAYPERAPMLKAIGLSHLLRYLSGELPYEKATELAKRDTRRLAKRQMTWFRNRCGDWTHLTEPEERAAALQAL